MLYRTCGIQGKGTTFIFTDQDVKEEAFLEYLNSVLSSGTITNLFNRDEQSEIISELIPIMKREFPKRELSQENVMEYFFSRVRQYLHIALCFSPVASTLHPLPAIAILVLRFHFIHRRPACGPQCLNTPRDHSLARRGPSVPTPELLSTTGVGRIWPAVIVCLATGQVCPLLSYCLRQGWAAFSPAGRGWLSPD